MHKKSYGEATSEHFGITGLQALLLVHAHLSSLTHYHTPLLCVSMECGVGGFFFPVQFRVNNSHIPLNCSAVSLVLWIRCSSESSVSIQVL